MTVMLHRTTATLLGTTTAFTQESKISAALQQSFSEKETANIIITFKETSRKSIINAIENQNFESRTKKLETLKQSLQYLSNESQLNVQNYLNKEEIKFKSFWISNQIYIKEATVNIVRYLSENFPEIDSIDEEQVIPNTKPSKARVPVTNQNVSLPGYGVGKIQAPEAWELGANGSGAVVANLDNGVFLEHEDLQGNFRSDHGWLAPEYVLPAPTPFDESGDGTETIGVVLGVAPGAQWISCRACGLFNCYQNWILACGEFSICPTNTDGSDPDCSKAASVVTATWGQRGGYNWFEPIVDAMTAAGIVPVFPAGNLGSLACGYINRPADLRKVIGVGYTDFVDLISGSSGTGPTEDERIKPDLSAPGEEILTTGHRPAEKYVEVSLSHMASAHTAGVVALLKSIDPNLSFAEVRRALIGGVETNVRTRDGECGGIPDTQFPNNYYGFGRINALNSVQIVKNKLRNRV